jgi:cold shock CspA family protein
VKNWNPAKGWGFIQCQETQQIYGKDIFVMRSALFSGENLTPGAAVRFSVQTGLKGVEATNVTSGGVIPGGVSGGVLGGGISPRPPPGPSGEQVYFGVVKAFNEEKGWGHIDCAGTHKLFDKDMFLLRSSLNGQMAPQGSLVSFKVVMGMKGPEAADVRVLPPGSFAIPGVEGSLFLGRIKNFNKDKGWGFIAGDEVRNLFDKDIFVHTRELGGWEPIGGEEVRFSVIINSDGRLEAATVSIGGEPGAEARPPATFEAPGYSPY